MKDKLKDYIICLQQSSGKVDNAAGKPVKINHTKSGSLRKPVIVKIQEKVLSLPTMVIVTKDQFELCCRKKQMTM